MGFTGFGCRFCGFRVKSLGFRGGFTGVGLRVRRLGAKGLVGFED